MEKNPAPSTGSEVDVRVQYALKDLNKGVDAGYFTSVPLDILEPTTKVLGYVQVKTGGQQ